MIYTSRESKCSKKLITGKKKKLITGEPRWKNTWEFIVIVLKPFCMFEILSKWKEKEKDPQTGEPTAQENFQAS